MSNNLEKLINEKRKDGMLQQKQIVNKVGVTNVTLCQAQSGQIWNKCKMLIKIIRNTIHA